MNYDQFIIFFRRRIEPFMVVGVLIVLVLIFVQVYNGNELREEISQNCGWGEEDFRCFCEKSEALEIKNKMYNLENNDGDIEYVQAFG